LVQAQPIVRVAIEPRNAAEMPILIQGLKKLNQADATVEVYVQETGEHVIAAAGELHLERCLRDLTEVFAPIQLEVSSPIVSFKETIVEAGKEVNYKLRGNLCVLKVVAKQLSPEIVAFIEANQAIFKEVHAAFIFPNEIHFIFIFYF
jgi:ribosome assembly protein 1